MPVGDTGWQTKRRVDKTHADQSACWVNQRNRDMGVGMRRKERKGLAGTEDGKRDGGIGNRKRRRGKLVMPDPTGPNSST